MKNVMSFDEFCDNLSEIVADGNCEKCIFGISEECHLQCDMEHTLYGEYLNSLQED